MGPAFLRYQFRNSPILYIDSAQVDIIGLTASPCKKGYTVRGKEIHFNQLVRIFIYRKISTLTGLRIEPIDAETPHTFIARHRHFEHIDLWTSVRQGLYESHFLYTAVIIYDLHETVAIPCPRRILNSIGSVAIGMRGTLLSIIGETCHLA